MTSNEMNLMIAELAAKCNVTQEEAKAALEAGNWNKLTAGQMLEDEKLRKAQEIEEVVSNCETATAQTTAQAVADEPTVDDQTEKVEQAGTTEKAEGDKHSEFKKCCCGKGMKNLGDHIRRLVACCNRNRFVVRRNDATLLELPVTVVVVLMLFAFWTCVPLLVIGLFLGCCYSFSGQDFDRAVEYMKRPLRKPDPRINNHTPPGALPGGAISVYGESDNSADRRDNLALGDCKPEPTMK